MNAMRALCVMFSFLIGLSGADFCSLRVVVTSSGGGEPDVPVIVELSSGRVIKKRYQSGGVEFCDLGIRPVKLVIGNECNEVTLSNVVLTWGELRTVRAIYDFCPVRERMPGTACEILLTARGESGEPLGGAKIHFTQPVPVTYTADKYGRILTGFGFGKRVEGEVSIDGHAPGVFAFRCTQEKPTIETEILLKRLP